MSNEKFFKAFLTSEKISFPKTHDLCELLLKSYIFLIASASRLDILVIMLRKRKRPTH